MANRRKVITLQRPPAAASTITATRIGNLLFSSTIPGVDPTTGQLGGTPEEQFDLAFENASRLLAHGGLSPDDVGLLTVFINDASYRSYINKPWLHMFPENHRRPARKTTHTEMPEGAYVHLQLTAVAGARRQELEISGIAHRDPLPVGVRIGDLVFSSVLGGDNPTTGVRPEGVPQIQQAFRNMRTLVEAAGGTTKDIVLVWVYLGDFAYQPAMVQVWLDMFPRDGDRPARKTFPYELGGSTLIQLQFVAALGGRRQNFEVPGIGHQDPIPLAASTGRVFYSSGITGVDPATGQLVDGPSAQMAQSLNNLGSLMAIAGESTADLASVTVLLGDHQYRAAVLSAWQAMFPDEADRPALHMMKLGVPGRATLVQLHAAAVLGR